MKRRTAWTVVATVGVAMALACSSGQGGTNNPEPNPASSQSNNGLEPAKVVSPTTKPIKSWGAGTYKVGEDISAGSYKTSGDQDGLGCTWQRLKNDSGELNAIIASDILGPGAPGRMTVKATDKFIEFSGGCKWTLTK